VNDWEIIADNLSKAGWSWGCVSALDREGRTIWIADAHGDDGKRFVVHSDEILTGVNEFLKEHNAFVEEQRKIEKLEATVTNLMATVKQQASQIQKVSAQLELNKAAPQTVLNNR